MRGHPVDGCRDTERLAAYVEKYRDERRKGTKPRSKGSSSFMKDLLFVIFMCVSVLKEPSTCSSTTMQN
jgi:hypothetical protein